MIPWATTAFSYSFPSGHAVFSAGAFLLARMAERFGGERYRAVTRAGSIIAVIAAVPCAPLLIAHHVKLDAHP